MIKVDREIVIQLVDDESMVLSMLGSHLDRLIPEQGFRKHQLIKLSHAKEAVDMHAKSKIDLTFLDIDLPDMDGLEALKNIRENNPKAYIVMVSGLGTADNVKNSLAAGANGFIVKPFTPEKITETLKKFKKVAFAELFK